ncbi:hypothetical protein [Mesorhizobium loti]|uniref:hypothetical protein n=1 Tax=Rhizobium loti TaxID=381 RepID=UPI0012693BF3|nr:hypothetical protein [Mesorhizobium loti]
MTTSESIELHFNDADSKLYGKLHAARHDLAAAQSYGLFLLKKRWKAKPWSRGSTYLQQSAFVTAMVTSYGRAFGGSRGWPQFPKELLDAYDTAEGALHRNVIRLRHQGYAHSDSQSYFVRPWRSDYHTDIEQVPILEFDAASTQTLVTMSQKMMAAVGTAMHRIKDRYP